MMITMITIIIMIMTIELTKDLKGDGCNGFFPRLLDAIACNALVLKIRYDDNDDYGDDDNDKEDVDDDDDDDDKDDDDDDDDEQAPRHCCMQCSHTVR